MPFQPFGYRFDVRSTKSVAEAKAALRSNMVGWFQVQNGPRGWIVGPVICLWLSAFDQYGPMLFGRIAQDNFGTRVRGRAGSDLNGVLMFSLLIPLTALLVYQLVLEGSASVRLLLVFGLVFLVGGPLIYWSAHKDRRQAEPLVNFVRRALEVTVPKPARRIRAKSGLTLPMQLVVCGDQRDGAPTTVEAVRDAVDAIQYNSDGFAILERGEEQYMQTAVREGGFILEKREGSEVAHFAAKRLDGTGDLFSVEEITEALLSYLEGRIETPGVHWERLHL